MSEEKVLVALAKYLELNLPGLLRKLESANDHFTKENIKFNVNDEIFYVKELMVKVEDALSAYQSAQASGDGPREMALRVMQEAEKRREEYAEREAIASQAQGFDKEKLVRWAEANPTLTLKDFLGALLDGFFDAHPQPPKEERKFMEVQVMVSSDQSATIGPGSAPVAPSAGGEKP